MLVNTVGGSLFEDEIRSILLKILVKARYYHQGHSLHYHWPLHMDVLIFLSCCSSLVLLPHMQNLATPTAMVEGAPLHTLVQKSVDLCDQKLLYSVFILYHKLQLQNLKGTFLVLLLFVQTMLKFLTSSLPLCLVLIPLFYSKMHFTIKAHALTYTRSIIHSRGSLNSKKNDIGTYNLHANNFFFW